MTLFQRKLRIIDYPWHQAHLYRLHALPALFWLAKIRRPLWNRHQRPLPRNFRGGLSESEVKKRAGRGKFDLALLHLDQWCDRISIRAFPFRMMRGATRGVPQVIIMHGTPDDGDNRRRLLSMIGDLPVVCNSEQARQEWDGGEEREDRYGLPQFRAIVHGYRVDEFLNFGLEERRPEAITICSGGDISRWYHGTAIVERLMRDIPALYWYGPMGNRPWCNTYDEYRTMLASSLVYLSPTSRAPMPGSRTEAMLSGCCVVSVPGNDWEAYVRPYYDGVICETYKEIRNVLRFLIGRPEVAYNIGQRGREVARQVFHHERYVAEWMDVLGEIGVTR